MNLLYKLGKREDAEAGCVEIYEVGVLKFRLWFKFHAIRDGYRRFSVELAVWKKGWENVVEPHNVVFDDFEDTAKKLIDLAIRFNDGE